MSSSVVPGDSVPAASKKQKPGKRERAAKRSLVGGSSGVPASTTKAQAFATGSSDPTPMPGKFPVVFQTGAGEPTRDHEFAINPDVLSSVLPSLPSRYTKNPRYTEFRASAGISDAQFSSQLVAASLLRLAQQIVHAHVNMGLPQGDFSPVASSDVRVPAALNAVLSQFGEWSAPSLGTRFLLRGYEDTVARIVFAATRVWDSGQGVSVLERSWLPMSSKDEVTKVVVAHHLNEMLKEHDVSILPSVLEDAVLSGEVPDAWEGIKRLLGEPPSPGKPDPRDRFDFLFKSYADVGQFTVAFTTVPASLVLAELDLPWKNPSAGHLDWQFNAKSSFSRVSDLWARSSAAYAQFFELSTGLANRSAARGSGAQMAEVSDIEGVTVLKTGLALSAPEFSLAACFPPSALFVGDITRNVVLTTPLSISQRATEFCQLDWR